MADNANTNPGASASSGTPPAGDNKPASGITPEQLHQQIEKARLEEREKLRTQLDNSRAEADKLRTENETLKGQLTKATDELTALKASMKPDGVIDVAKAIAEAVQAATSRVSGEFAQEIAGLRGQLDQERSVRTQLTLEQRKAQLIADAGGSNALIPELVHGSNEDELAASIERSKQIFQRTVGSVKSGAQSTATNNGNPSTGVPPSIPLPASGGAGNPAGDANLPPTSVRGMPLREYAKKREELKRSVAGRYANNYVTQ